MSSFAALFNPAGGVKYHFAAWRYRHHWQAYRQEIYEWMQAWQVPSKKIILFGPSGGYCLKTEFLQSFKEIIAVDPDPLAAWHFSHQHPGLTLDWDRGNYLLGANWVKRLRELLAQHPHHGLLYCNLLGQLRFVSPRPNDEPAIRLHLQQILNHSAGHPLLSFHDRLSGKIKPSLEQVRKVPQTLNDEQILSACYAPQSGNLLDHFTGQLFDEIPASYFSWELSPGQYQLIEGVFRS
jgi:hypothetical protein